MGKLSGKVAIVTGAGGGIGSETALVLAGHGAKIVVTAHRHETGDKILELLKSKGFDAVAAIGDVSDDAVAKAAVAAAIDNFGRIDILHNNAAATGSEQMSKDVEITGFDAAVWHRAMSVNVYGPAQLCKYAIPHMIKQGGGSIIMTSSGRGVQGDLGYPAYGASKAALMNLSANIAVQYGKQGIRSNAIVVGFVLTPKNQLGVPDPMKTMLERHTLTPDVGTPNNIAQTVAFLASDESAFITGSNIYCDGGIALHSPPVADMREMTTTLVPAP
jgi:NAD(P)-dependent dehydrogenase (short-subunit alcohol dehydrogenase family)